MVDQSLGKTKKLMRILCKFVKLLVKTQMYIWKNILTLLHSLRAGRRDEGFNLPLRNKLFAEHIFRMGSLKMRHIAKYIFVDDCDLPKIAKFNFRRCRRFSNFSRNKISIFLPKLSEIKSMTTK